MHASLVQREYLHSLLHLDVHATTDDKMKVENGGDHEITVSSLRTLEAFSFSTRCKE